MSIKKIFTPFQSLSGMERLLVNIATYAAIFLIWQYLLPKGFPRPFETWEAFTELLFQEGIVPRTWNSLYCQLWATTLAVLFGLFLAYSYAIPGFKPVVNIICALRAVSPGALVVLFYITIAKNGFQLKVDVMAFAVGAFFLTSVAKIVAETKQTELNVAYHLGYNEWGTLYEQIIRGKLHNAWSALEQNNLMGWSMLMMVEGLVQADAGIGKLMYDDQKHSNLPSLLALIIWTTLIGLFFDKSFRWAGKKIFKYIPKEVG